MTWLLGKLFGAWCKWKIRRAFPEDIFARSHAFWLAGVLMEQRWPIRQALRHSITVIQERLPELRELARKGAI